MDIPDNSKWIRPAGLVENLFEICQRGGSSVTGYWLTLRTTAPLQETHVREALLHLYRKVPTLRVCLRERDGETLWWHEMDAEEIDFQVLEGGADPMETLEMTIHRRFDSARGPLWCAAFIPESDPCCPMTELHQKFPHSSSLILGNHHGIADGTTNMKVIDLFLQILNDVIGDEVINDDEQLGEHTSDEETSKLLDTVKTELEQDEDKLAALLEDIKDTEGSLLYLKAFPSPEDSNPTTKVMTFDLDKETTERFLGRCKREGITANSGFVTLINVSLVDLMKEAGMQQNKFQIKEMHDINLRRYWPGDTDRVLGVHIGVLKNIIDTPSNWRDDFWGYAKSFHHKFHQNLKDKIPIRDFCLEVMALPEESLESYFGEHPLPKTDYETSNMRNLDTLITTDGDHARMTRIVGASAYTREFMLHMFQSFRGRFLYSLSYYTYYVTQESAQELVNQIFSNLRSVC